MGELRLKALQSLKRPYISPVPASTEKTENESSIVRENEQVVMKRRTDIPKLDREEGEITDTNTTDSSDSEFAEISENEQYGRETTRKDYKQRKWKFKTSRNLQMQTAATTYNKRSKYHGNTTWTRSSISISGSGSTNSSGDEISSVDLEYLLLLRSAIIGKLDENQSILAASEDHEQDLLTQIQECRVLQRKCELERSKSERKLDKIDILIRKNESIQDKVSCTNSKKLFVGKMFKETYLRCLQSFKTSQLYQLYNEILDLDPFPKKVDVMVPFCLTELSEGICPFKNDSCTLQHLTD